MQILEKVSEDEAVALFLKGELGSKRFSFNLKNAMAVAGVGQDVIESPDITDAQQNFIRKTLLSAFRGYGKNEGVFENFPRDIQWMRVGLSPQEVLKTRYIDHSYWNEISNTTHSPVVAAETIRKGVEIFGVSNLNFLEAADYLRGGGVFPEMLLLAEKEDSPLTVLEGHLRLTAYALAPEYIPDPLTAIAGFSKDVAAWL